MEFSFRKSMKNALIQAVGSKPDYDILIAAGDWVKLGVFVESDVAEIQAAIDAQYIIIEEAPEND